MLTTLFLGTPIWLWLTFAGVIVALLAFDLGVLFRKDHEMSLKESAWLSAFYVSIGVLFSVWVYLSSSWVEVPGSAAPADGTGTAVEQGAAATGGHGAGDARVPQDPASRAFTYLTAFVVEKSLSLDNIFVMAVIFGYFGIPRMYQHRVLFYGILGVIILRGIMIGVGAAVVAQFHWVLYLFGAFLIYSGIKLWSDKDEEPDIENNAVLKFLRQRYPITDGLRGNRFTVQEARTPGGPAVLHLTPLFVCLCVIEFMDVLFAVDSIPAVFALTTDTYIVYTSNLFAILGLRALFFLLSAALKRFEYLHYAMSMLLVVIGAKVFIADFVLDGHFPSWLSMLLTFAILGGGVAFSLYKTSGEPVEDPDAQQGALAPPAASGDGAVHGSDTEEARH